MSRKTDIIVECDNCETKAYLKSHTSKEDITKYLEKEGWKISDYVEYCCEACEEVAQESCEHNENPEWVHNHGDWAECTVCGKIFEEDFDAQRVGK